MIILIFVILCIIRSSAIAFSGPSQEVAVNSLNLSATGARANEDFFFRAHTVLTMQEWVDQSGIQKPAVIDGPLLETGYNIVGLAFDGIDDAVTVPNSGSLNPMNELTVEMRIQFSSYGSNAPGRDWFTLLSKGSYWGSASYCLLLAANTSDRSILFLLNGTRVASAKTFAENYMWYDIVATYGGSSAAIFLNGELLARAPFQGNLTDNNDDLCIGWEKGNIYPLNGVVGAFRIYNRTLSPDEIELLYQREISNNNVSLVLDLNLGNLKYGFERSEDGLNFHEVFQNSVNQTIFSWKENQAGKYFYRISMLSIENNTTVIRYSNIVAIDVVRQESTISLVELVYALVLVLTSIAVLFSSRKDKGVKVEKDLP